MRRNAVSGPLLPPSTTSTGPLGANRSARTRSMSCLTYLEKTSCRKNIVSGEYQDHQGVLVATNHRLLFLRRRWFSLAVEEFDFSEISSVGYQTGKSSGELEIRESGGGRAEFKSVHKDHIGSFAEYLKGRISGSEPEESPKTEVAEPRYDWVSQLDRLAALKARGSISDAEFEAEQKRILGSL